MPDALTLFHALCSGTGRHLLGLPGFRQHQAVSPKSWVSGRKLRSSNCSPESQKKENSSLPGWCRMNFTCIPGCHFQDLQSTASGCLYLEVLTVRRRNRKRKKCLRPGVRVTYTYRGIHTYRGIQHQSVRRLSLEAENLEVSLFAGGSEKGKSISAWRLGILYL